jgi:hypothetical protein
MHDRLAYGGSMIGQWLEENWAMIMISQIMPDPVWF